MAYSKQIVYLSEAQYQTLVTNGSITVSGQTITYNANNIYVTPQTAPVTDVEIDGTSVVTNGVADLSALKNEINAKQDAPETAGTAGQVLGLATENNELVPKWIDQSGGGGGGSGNTRIIPVTYDEEHDSFTSDYDYDDIISLLDNGGYCVVCADGGYFHLSNVDSTQDVITFYNTFTDMPDGVNYALFYHTLTFTPSGITYNLTIFPPQESQD